MHPSYCVTNVLTCVGSWHEHFQVKTHTNTDTHKHAHTPPWPLFFLKTTYGNFIISRFMHPSFFHSVFFLVFRGCRLQMGMLRHPIAASGWGNTESSSIQEMMAGPNTILNRTRGGAGYKSILSPNDDHHLEHIFRAHCCLDVWLSWGSLIHKTTHWSYEEVTFKRGNAKSNFWVEPERWLKGN